MSYENNRFKELINEAIHNHFHDKTETEMILKDWLYGICEQLDKYEAKAKAFDKYHATISSHLHLKSEPEFSSPPTEVLSDIIDIHNEYEAKAKAYDDTLKTLDKLINDDERYKEARSNDFIAGMLIAYENIFNLMEDYIKEGCE